MAPEIVALIGKPHLLVLLLGIGAICGMVAERFVARWDREKPRTYWSKRRYSGSGNQTLPFRREQTVIPFRGMPDHATVNAAEQLRCVMEAQFEARPLLNRSERRLFGVIDAALAEHSPGWRAMGQVSLGEILASPNEDAFFAVNSKRVDLLIIDAECRPLHAIEFQGKGHHIHNNTAARDAVKKEALRRAGIGYIEIVSGDTPSEVREIVRKLVKRMTDG